MPIYEYECSACGKTSEVLQAMSATVPEKCPICGQGPLRKLMSLSGFVLKGGGFYTNEYPSASRKAGMAESKPETVKSVVTNGDKTTASEAKTETTKSMVTENSQPAKSEIKPDTAKSSGTDSKT